MKNNEAVARMKYRIDTATDISGKGADGKAYEDMEMAILALEKQIPKEPKERCKTRYIWDSAYCPVCDCGITARWNFCQNCGQAIDWNS